VSEDYRYTIGISIQWYELILRLASSQPRQRYSLHTRSVNTQTRVEQLLAWGWKKRYHRTKHGSKNVLCCIYATVTGVLSISRYL